MLQFCTTIGFNIRPPFYYHLILSYPVPTQSWIISLISTSLLFVCINSTILTEILKNNLERKLLVKAKTGMDEQKKIFFSTIALILLAGCNIAAFIHYLFIVEAPKITPRETVLLTFAVYFFCEGFIVPVTIILSVENLRNYLKIKMVAAWKKMKSIIGFNCVIPTAKIEPIV